MLTAAVALCVLLLVAACTGGSSKSGRTSGSGATGSSATGSTSSGVKAFLKIAYAGPEDSLDPDTAADTYAAPLFQYPLYDRLFEVNPDNKIVPMVAKSYSFAKDGSSLTVVMRSDVKFHDGSPVNAAAVKASIERGKTLANSNVKSNLAGITSVDVVNEFTVRFSLDANLGAAAPGILSTNAGAIMNPKVLNDPSVKLGLNPPAAAGSGPYVSTGFTPNQSASYKPAPTYWNPAKQGTAGFSIAAVVNNQTSLSGLQAGDFNLILAGSGSFAAAQAAVKAGRLKMVQTTASPYSVLYNITRGSLANATVRKAISLATDRAAYGQLQPCEPTTQPELPGMIGYNPNIKAPFDLNQAKTLVQQAGGASFSLGYPSGGPQEPLATLLASQLEKAGIKVTLRPVAQSDIFSLFQNGQLDAIFQNMVPNPEPSNVLNNYFFGGYNIAKGPVGDQLHQLAAKGTDTSLSADQRSAVYQQLFAKAMSENIYLSVCQGVTGWPYANDLTLPNFDKIPYLSIATPDFTYLQATKP